MLSKLTTWLWSSALSLLAYFYNIIVDLVNGAISTFAAFIVAAAALLPDYTVPVPSAIIDQNNFLSTMNWLLPISFFVNVLSMMIVAYGLYLTVGTLLRWGKVLKG